MTTTTVTPNQGELLAQAMNPATGPALFADTAKAQEWVSALEAAQTAHDADVLAKAQEQAQNALVDMLKSEGTVARLDYSDNRKGYEKSADGAKIEGICASQSEYLQAIYHNQRDASLRAKATEILNSMTTVTPGDGGFLVPESMRNDILTPALEQEVVRPRATVVPMATSRVRFPVNDVTSHASTLFGGVAAYWAAEEAALTASQPKFAEVILDANKLTILAYVTAEMLQDSAISLPGYLGGIMPKAIAHAEDVKFIRGVGVGEPLGFLNSPAKVAVSARDGQLAGTILWENLVDMFARLLPGSHRNSVWIANPNCIPELATMALSVGTGGAPIVVSDGTKALPQTLLGQPLIYSEKMSTKGTEGDIALVDLSYYLIGDRQQLTAATSTDFKFNQDLVTYRFIERLDGRPALLSAITPNQGTDTLTAFVTLATRA